MLPADFALFNVDQLVTVSPGGHPHARGELGVIDRAALAAKDSKIVWLGRMDDFHDHVRLEPDSTILNTHGRTVLPGFVDPHTHPVFAGERQGDFYRRALGESYAEQLKSGGIMETVRATRDASEESLLATTFARADTFLQYGTTTIQAKTGYGLTQESELRSLNVLNRLQHLHALKVIPAFMGAHIVPTDYTGSADEYIQEIIDRWLPAADGRAAFVDVWIDEGAFTGQQGRRLLERAREMGYRTTAHAGELGPGDGVRTAAESGATSVDHLVYISDDSVALLREHGTVAVLLPGTSFSLGAHTFAPARRLIDAGVTVALGTDFNPGTSFTQNMQFVLTLAVLKLRMSAEEAIRGATINAARAVGMEDRLGSLEVGKYCDLSVFYVDDYRALPYQYAMNLVESVVASGRVVVRDGKVASASVPALVP